MAGLLRRSRLTGLALVLAFALTVLPGLVAPLVSDELVSWLPSTTAVYAEETHGGGG